MDGQPGEDRPERGGDARDDDAARGDEERHDGGLAPARVGTLGAAVAGGVAEPRGREAAVVTFLVAASGVVVAGIAAAVWAILAGLAVHATLTVRRRAPGPTSETETKTTAATAAKTETETETPAGTPPREIEAR